MPKIAKFHIEKPLQSYGLEGFEDAKT